MLKVKNSFTNKDDENCNLEVLEMIAITNEHAKELSYVKNIKWTQRISNALWIGGGNINPCFLLLVF
jgi:hypothetical protein